TLIFVVFSLIFILIFLANRIGLDILSFVVARASTFLKISQDISINQRLLADKIVWEQILKNPFVGNGLGSQYSYSYLGTTFSEFWVDNSYLVLLWKLGIVGAITFLGILIKSLIESIKIFKVTKNNEIKVFAGAMISFIIAWLILGTISPQMIKYLLNVVWITLIALIYSVKNLSYVHNNSNF
ncbi:unnamed protein product, partial [marine sediment metagenome]